MAAISPSLLLPHGQTLASPQLHRRLLLTFARRAPALSSRVPARKRHGPSRRSPPPHAVAAEEAAVETEELEQQASSAAAMEVEVEVKKDRVVLPTNDSSERLLRIRHTVSFFALKFVFSWIKIRSLHCL